LRISLNKKIDLRIHKYVFDNEPVSEPIPCPDGIEGCAVAHYGLVIPNYSTDISEAWDVVEKMQHEFDEVNIHVKDGMVSVIIDEYFSNGFFKDRHEGYERKLPLAICKSALKAIGKGEFLDEYV